MISNNSAAVNGSMSPSSSAANPQSQGLKAYFKTPEGRYKLHFEKTHPAGLLPYAHGKSVTQITLAQLKEKPVQALGTPSSSYSTTSGVRYVAARFLGSSNGSRGLSFVGGNGTSKANGGASRSGSFGGLNGSGSNSVLNSNFDGKGTYLIFNVGDTLYISDLNSQDKDPIKAIHFSNSNPVCHAFDCEAKDGHDLLIGLSCGDVYSVSLRQQLQDVGKKLVGAQHYNKDGSTNNSRCTGIAWIPGRDGAFVVAHADGNLYVYEKCKDGTGEASFPVIKDQTQFSVAHAKSSKSNPIARWHICQGSINSIAFSTDGKFLATVGRDGYLRVFDYSNEQLSCGGKSYYGALLCCAWSGDGKYILAGGEDDLVQVWSMEDRKIVAWGEGHNSWVSSVAFDSYWSPPTSEDTEEDAMYRFGSVGQVCCALFKSYAWLHKDRLSLPQMANNHSICGHDTVRHVVNVLDCKSLSTICTNHTNKKKKLFKSCHLCIIYEYKFSFLFSISHSQSLLVQFPHFFFHALPFQTLPQMGFELLS